VRLLNFAKNYPYFPHTIREVIAMNLAVKYLQDAAFRKLGKKNTNLEVCNSPAHLSRSLWHG
jgi:hypothetical protein